MDDMSKTQKRGLSHTFDSNLKIVGSDESRSSGNKKSNIKNNIYLLLDNIYNRDEIETLISNKGYNAVIVDETTTYDHELTDESHAALITETSHSNHALIAASKEKEIPIIFTSYQDTIKERLIAVRAGGSYFITHPINDSVLDSTIDKATTPRSIQSYKVLIIDDDEILAAYHEMIILRAGMMTIKVNDPLQSLHVIAEFMPDLILMDLYMPSCSGTELSRIIRQKEKYAGIPIVFLSTESDLQEQMAAMEFGGDDFLSKPVTPERLVAAVSNRARRSIETNTISADLKILAAELKTKTEDLDDALTAARSSESLKSRLIATMSHEIRTPINGMLGIMDKMLQTDLDMQQKEFVEIALSSTESLLSILNDTLDFSKLEAGKMSLEKIKFTPQKTIDQVLKLFDETASAKGITLNSSIDRGVPEQLYGDPVRLKQILINLINNAIKFTDDGEIMAKISVKNEGNNHIKLLFKIIDSGIGMTLEQQENIFDEYSQAEKSTSRTHGGTGLGLSICQKLANIMGGEIGVTSKFQKGSTFWFTADFSRNGDNDSSEATSNPPTDSLINYRSRSPIALIAEDSEVNQMIISSYLQKHGITSHIANNGENAITQFTNHQYDLVFMDCQMPVLDGYQATRIIRGNENNSNKNRTPIIAMTGNALSGDREKCLDSGMDDYLTKPIKKEILAELLEKWLGEKP